MQKLRFLKFLFFSFGMKIKGFSLYIVSTKVAVNLGAMP